METTSVENTVVSFLRNMNGAPSSAAVISGETNLIEARVLDSLGIFQLIAFLESRFNVSVLPSELALENFRNVSLIVAFIERKLSHGSKSLPR